MLTAGADAPQGARRGSPRDARLQVAQSLGLPQHRGAAEVGGEQLARSAVVVRRRGTGSVAWPAVLGFRARLLEPIFSRPRAWQGLEIFVAAIMVGTRARLMIGA